MRHWLERLPSRYPRVERFNHDYPLRAAPPSGRSLEIGAGLGGHVEHEDLSVQEYHAVELRPELANALRERVAEVRVVAANCQEGLPYPDGFFDRVLAIHVLEHLPDLPSALDEVQRVLQPHGRFVVVIPCEGGLGYSLGRRLTVQRTFQRRYGVPYEPFVRAEHLNVPGEIQSELRSRFQVIDETYWPLRVPWVHPNLLIGITLEHFPGS